VFDGYKNLSIYRRYNKKARKFSVDWIFAIIACDLGGSPWWCPVNGPSDPEGAW